MGNPLFASRLRGVSCGILRRMADHAERLAELRAILQSGVSSHTVDGQTTHYDLASLKAELRELERADDEAAARRPRSARIHLG